MSYTSERVIDEMNKKRELCQHEFKDYRCIECGAMEKVTCLFCKHETYLEESEGEIWHWADCPIMDTSDEYDPSEQYARDRYLKK